MWKPLCLLISVSMISACGGRAANPVMPAQYGDEKKSCRALQVDMMNTQAEITNLLPKTDKTGKNVALGVTGFFLIVPLFFMDMKESEQIEVNALRQRYNHLVSIAADKECGYENKPIPELTKSKVE